MSNRIRLSAEDLRRIASEVPEDQPDSDVALLLADLYAARKALLLARTDITAVLQEAEIERLAAAALAEEFDREVTHRHTFKKPLSGQEPGACTSDAMGAQRCGQAEDNEVHGVGVVVLTRARAEIREAPRGQSSA